MYLENAEKAKLSGERESSSEAMLTEQHEVVILTKTADPLQDSIELGIKVLVEYTEQIVTMDVDSSLQCLEHCKMSNYEGECGSCGNGHAESFMQYPTCNGFLESNQSLDNCETSRLNQSCNECVQHFDCLKSWEQSANHSIACNKCCPSCEHSAEHLRRFQQCEPFGQQFESFDFEPNTLVVECDSLGLYEMSDFTPGSSDNLELHERYESEYEQSECSDSEVDTSAEDSEPNNSDSVDSLDCGTELGECDEIQNQSECTNSDEDDYDDDENEEDDEERSLCEQNGAEATLSEDSDDCELVNFASECCEKFQEAQELSQQTPTLDMSTDHCEMCGYDDFETSEEYETSQQCAASDRASDSSESCAEEDRLSDCSSVETKSFKTCRNGSIPSDPFADLFGECEKEDSCDEQTQWESCEDEDEVEQSYADQSDEDTKKMPPKYNGYFDLFDSADYHGHAFAPKQRYISCFDGGDIHECLYLEEAAKHNAAENEDTVEDSKGEMNAQESAASSEEAHEEAADPSSTVDCGSEKDPEDWITETESSLAEEGEEGEEGEYDEEKEGEALYTEKEEAEECLSSVSEETVFAPCAEDISVEGDAYEEELCDVQNHESLSDDASTFEHGHTSVTVCKKDNEPEDKPFIECSEKEPYWSLIDNEGTEELDDLDVEDYYAYQVKSLQSSFKQASNGLYYYQILCGKDDGFTPRNEGADDPPSESETELQAPGVCPAVTNGITEVSEVSEGVASRAAVEEAADEATPESDNDSNDSSTDIRYPLDIIHSVKPVVEDEQTDENDYEQSSDSEEEPSDDESSELCDCEYCIPPIEQVPTKPLLPTMISNDTAKICVVIDLDETLVHSSFKPLNNADYIIPVEIDETVYQVHVLKRPHVDEFLQRMGELFECVLFTASLAKYADPVSDLLDKCGAFQSRLFRESCVYHKGNYVKDLSRLGRDLNKVIIIDNSPASYIFHPENAVPVASWFNDTSDTELLDLIPFFERLSKSDDVYDTLKQQATSS